MKPLLRRLAGLAGSFALAASLPGCAAPRSAQPPPEPDRPWRVLVSSFSSPAQLPRMKMRSANACVDGCISGSVGGGAAMAGAQASPGIALGCLAATCLFAGGKYLFAGPEITSDASPHLRVYSEALRAGIADALTDSLRLDATADTRMTAPSEMIAQWTSVQRAEYMRDRAADAMLVGDFQSIEEVIDPTVPGDPISFLRVRAQMRLYRRSGEQLLVRVAQAETDPKLPVSSLGTREIAQSAGRVLAEKLMQRLWEVL